MGDGLLIGLDRRGLANLSVNERDYGGSSPVFAQVIDGDKDTTAFDALVEVTKVVIQIQLVDLHRRRPPSPLVLMRERNDFHHVNNPFPPPPDCLCQEGMEDELVDIVERDALLSRITQHCQLKWYLTEEAKERLFRIAECIAEQVTAQARMLKPAALDGGLADEIHVWGIFAHNRSVTGHGGPRVPFN